MTVFTIVQRALPPLSLPWRRRSSLKDNSPETEFDLTSDGSIPEPNGPNAEHNASTDLHSGVSTLSPLQAHLAVRETHASLQNFSNQYVPLRIICLNPSRIRLPRVAHVPQKRHVLRVLSLPVLLVGPVLSAVNAGGH